MPWIEGDRVLAALAKFCPICCFWCLLTEVGGWHVASLSTGRFTVGITLGKEDVDNHLYLNWISGDVGLDWMHGREVNGRPTLVLPLARFFILGFLLSEWQIGRPPLSKLRKSKWVLATDTKSHRLRCIQPAISWSLRGIYVGWWFVVSYDVVMREPKDFCELKADVILREPFVTRIV